MDLAPPRQREPPEEEGVVTEELQQLILDRARREGFTAEELTNAKAGLLASRRQSRSQDGFVASYWVERLYLNENFLKGAEMDAKLQAVTLDDVNAAFRKYIDPEKFTIVKAGDFARAEKLSSTGR